MEKINFKLGLKWLFISAFLTGISITVWLVFSILAKNKTQAVPVRIATVTQGDVENKITGESGIFQLNNQRSIQSPTAGTVKKILVRVGDYVKKDQALIILQDVVERQIKLQDSIANLKDRKLKITDQELALQIKKQGLIEFEKTYKNIQNTYESDILQQKQDKLQNVQKAELDIYRKQRALTVTEAESKADKIKLEEDKQLLSKGYIPETELKDQKKKTVQDEINLSNAKDDLSLSKLALDKQKLDLNNFFHSIQNNRTETQQKLQDAKSKIQEALQGFNDAKLALNQTIEEIHKLNQEIAEESQSTIIPSPIDGVVLDLQVKLGDVLDPAKVNNILLIGDPDKQIVELKLSPFDATKVKLGEKAEISIVGSQSQKFTGYVQQVSLLAEGTQNDNRGADNSTSAKDVKIAAIVRLDKVNKNIALGTPVTVDIITSHRDRVTVIPISAVQGEEPENFVWMLDKQGKAVKRTIKVGLQGLDSAEVKLGLKLGDKVLIPFPENPLHIQDKVVIKTQPDEKQ